MDTVSALAGLRIGGRPLRGFLKVTVQVLLTICLDVEINDNMVLGYLDVVDLVSIDVLQSSANVRPSELRGSRRPCLLSRALHENLVEDGLFLVKIEGVGLFWGGVELRRVQQVVLEPRIDTSRSIPLNPSSLFKIVEVILELLSEYVPTLRVRDITLFAVFLV